VNPLGYYAKHSPLTDPGEYVELLVDLPCTINDLRRVVQGVYIHYMAGEEHGYEIPANRLYVVSPNRKAGSPDS
jgi:hypothetical protein